MTHQQAFPPTILMIRPVRFGFNQQTAVNNAFQMDPGSQAAGPDIQARALEEFDRFAEALNAVDIPLLIVDDTEDPHTPDSIFPNNWITTHPGNTVVLYPMFAGNRRRERKPSVLSAIRQHFRTGEVIDMTAYEREGRFLEGTGSFILDRQEKIAYACLSPRTDEGLFNAFCTRMDFRPVVFHATDQQGVPIYHTNVMMCVADKYAVINLESIHGEDRKRVEEALTGSGKTIVGISQLQMESFAGNMLQIFNRSGEPYLVMSTQAYQNLHPDQIALLERFNPILHVPLDTIERNGGGSARCMMAELYLDTNQAG